MSRHSSLCAISLAICFFVPATIFAQGANQTTSPIDVLYLVTQNTIQTYNVDPSYGSATLYGTLTVPAPSNSYPTFVPGVDGHYLYVFCTCGTQGTVLWVYATDSNGAPQAPPVQTLGFKTPLPPFVIDPNGTLAYAAELLPQGPSPVPEYGIQAFALNPATGIVTANPGFSATTFSPTGCGTIYAFGNPTFSLVGFNGTGTQLIDAWYCQGHDDSWDPYYTQTVHRETGALGPPVANMVAGSSMSEYWRVTFTPRASLVFVNFGFNGSQNQLYVYWPNVTLDFECTYTMLDACSYSGGIAADRTGKFIFFYTNTGATEVTRLDVNKKTIEPVGIPLADTISAFSLDDQLIYGSPNLSGNGQYVTPVYVFDPSTGLVTDNGEAITTPSQYDSLIPAWRY
jgi:hypothetical protein